jgi:hypothetical protein
MIAPAGGGLSPELQTFFSTVAWLFGGGLGLLLFKWLWDAWQERRKKAKEIKERIIIP